MNSSSIGGTKRKVTNGLAMAGLIIIFIAYMFPFIMVVINSLKEKRDIIKSPFSWLFTIKGLLSYRATGSLDHWLVKVLRNEFLNQRRDRSRRGEEDLPEHLADPSPTLPEQLIADEEKRRLYSAIARLPVLQRSILLDSVYFGLTDGEIADTHHITRENVRQLRSRAKRRLREELGEEEPS